MGKYKVIYLTTSGGTTVTEVVEADSEQEARIKCTNYFRDGKVRSVEKLPSAKAATEGVMELQEKVANALAYRSERLLEVMPQVDMLMRQRRAIAESHTKEPELMIEAIEYVETKIKELLGIN